MTKFTNKIALCLLLGLGFLPLAAYSNNSLTQLDIKKSASSDSALNITLYTSSPYDDNVAISRKSDNKYVILMPNISGSSQSAADLSGLRDVVSDVDIKSVQDGDNGYTKVTLTTTKPVTIRTSAKRSAPLTPEQKAYKNLIAQSRTAKPSVAASDTGAAATVKLKDKTVEPVAPAKSKDKTPAVSAAVKSKNKTVEPAAAGTISPKQQSKPVNVNNTAKEKTANVVQNKASDSTKRRVSEIEEILAYDAERNNAAANNEEVEIYPKSDISLNPVQENISVPTMPIMELKDKTNKGNLPDMFTMFAILLCSVFGLSVSAKLINKSVEHSKLLKNSFKENLSEKPAKVNKYDDIVNDSGLSWQEKYQKFVRNAMPAGYKPGVIGQIDSGEYRFHEAVARNLQPIKPKDVVQTGSADSLPQNSGNAKLKPAKANKLTAYNKSAKNISPEDIPPIKKVKNQDLKPSKTVKLKPVDNTVKIEHDYKKLEETLERTLHKAPDMEQMKIDEDAILKQMQSSLNSVPVVSETDKIADTMHKTRKLKTFANKIALEETKRNLPLPKLSSEIKKSGNIESKHVELGSSSLHTNPRKFDGANLSVGDLIAKSGKFMTSPVQSDKEMKAVQAQKDYSTVTIDEFFNNIGYSNSANAPVSLASRVADSLGKMSVEPSITQIRKQVQAKTNPFEGMVIQAGYRVTDESGFYVVKNKDGNTSLIGRVYDKTTLLKDFGSESDVKLQVRRDNRNVYMVKANGYRYLVEVNNDNMGVLLEL